MSVLKEAGLFPTVAAGGLREGDWGSPWFCHRRGLDGEVVGQGIVEQSRREGTLYDDGGTLERAFEFTDRTVADVATVLELARDGASLAGVVSLHGGLSTSAPAASAVAPAILVLNGADDRGVSAEEIAGFQQEMDAVDADWQFVNFAGAVHCFAESDADSPPNCVYHERSAKRAWRMMDDFFEERFGQRSP